MLKMHLTSSSTSVSKAQLQFLRSKLNALRSAVVGCTQEQGLRSFVSHFTVRGGLKEVRRGTGLSPDSECRQMPLRRPDGRRQSLTQMRDTVTCAISTRHELTRAAAAVHSLSATTMSKVTDEESPLLGERTQDSRAYGSGDPADEHAVHDASDPAGDVDKPQVNPFTAVCFLNAIRNSKGDNSD